MNYYALAIGTVVAVYAVVQIRMANYETSNWAYPVLLASFPIYYWAFAIFASDYDALIYEVAIGLVFLLLAYVAYRLKNVIGLLLLALGYIGHGVYDAVHNSFFQNHGAPLWWPEFCGSVDVLIGLYLAFLVISTWKRPTEIT